MTVEVDFITLGDASDRLEIPSPTLRHWSDQLEDLEVHYLNRNNRNERIYYDTDLEIFDYIRMLKKKHGRKVTMRDIVNTLREEGMFEFRTQDEVPMFNNPSNKTTDLINQSDIKQLLNSERVKQLMSVVIDQTTKNLKDDLIKSVREEVKLEVDDYHERMKSYQEQKEQEFLEREEKWKQELKEMREKEEKEMDEYNKKLSETHERLERELKERDERWEERAKKRDEMLVKSMRETMEARKPWWKKMFGEPKRE